MFSTESSAIIPYSVPLTPIEFIRSEVDKGLINGTIKLEQLKVKFSTSLGQELKNLEAPKKNKVVFKHYHVDPQVKFILIKANGKLTLDSHKNLKSEYKFTVESKNIHTLSFESILVKKYGTLGLETFKKVVDALNDESLSVAYNCKNTIFTVIDSSQIDKKVEKVFKKYSYRGWEPQVLDEVDILGNKLIHLKAITKKSKLKITR